MKNYVVIGLGLFGMQIAMKLYDKGKNVLAIDLDPEKTENIADHVTRAATANATKKDTLIKLGVHKCDCAIVSMSRDLSASILITMNLKALGLKEIICKAQSLQDKEVLETLGATQVIVPELLSADRLCKKLLSANIVDYIDLFEGYSIMEIHTPKSFISHNLKELNIRAKYGVTVIAIKEGDSIIVSPTAEERLRDQSILVLLGSDKCLGKMKKIN